MNSLRVVILFTLLLLSACASNPMQTATNQTLGPVPSDQAQIVFMRSSMYGGGINASLYDVTGGNLEFIGIIANGSKIAHTTAPGKHTYMVVSEAADFMEANLLEGKTYYSIVTPRMGAWKARFSLRPVRNDGTTDFNTASPEFKKWVSGTQLVTTSPQAIQWFERNKGSILTKQADYLPVWKRKSAEDLASRTLNPNDGM